MKNQPDIAAGNIAETAATRADQAIRATQRVTNDALDSLSDSVNSAGQRVSPLINRASEQASALAQRSMEAVRNGSQQLRDKATQATDATTSYIRNDPIKSVLIAAAAGAAIVALVGLMTRSRNE